MRHTMILILIAALMLCAVFPASGLAEGPVSQLWDSGCRLLFDTDNVTVKGEASFSLDGEHFKTAQLHYVQDGFSSYYGLKLLTPRADGTQRETGWTIIGQESETIYGMASIYAMEAYEPGVYRAGLDGVQNSLLRRTVQLNALAELGGALAGQMEKLLPEGAVAVEETEGGKTVRIKLARDQIPSLAAGAANLAAGYFSSRWLGAWFDRSVTKTDCPYECYVTVTEALVGGTVRWELGDVDVAFSLDDQNRLTAVSGSVQAASVYWDGTVRSVTVQMDFAASDYGTSIVKPFDPADYHVTLAPEYYGEEAGEEAEPAAEEAM